MGSLADAAGAIKTAGKTILDAGLAKVGGNFPFQTSITDSSAVLMTDKNIQIFVKGTITKSNLDDPTYLGFTLMFDWYMSPLFKGWSTGGSSQNIGTVDAGSTDKKYPIDGALGYLQNRGMDSNVANLELFIRKLQELVNEKPYYFQSISGLEGAWGKWVDFNKDPYRGGEDSVVSINTLENVELNIQNLLYVYQMATDDMIYRREIVPDNLVKFDLYVHVMEIRSFTDYSGDLMINDMLGEMGAPGGRKIPDNSKLDAIQNFKANLSDVMITFKQCEFVPATDNKLFGELFTNEQASNSLSFKYEDVDIKSFANWFNDAVGGDLSAGIGKDGPAAGFLSKLKSKIKEVVSSAANSLVGAASLIAVKTMYSAANIATVMVEEAISKIEAKGNIYDGKTTIGDVLDVIRSGNLISGVGLALDKAKSNSANAPSKPLLEKIYDTTNRNFKSYEDGKNTSLFSENADIPKRISTDFDKINKTTKIYENVNGVTTNYETSNILVNKVNTNLNDRVSSAFTTINLMNLYKK